MVLCLSHDAILVSHLHAQAVVVAVDGDTTPVSELYSSLCSVPKPII